MKKRVQVWVMALVMLFTAVAFPILNAESVKAAESDLTVKLHYLRSDGNYENWDVWAWPEGADGAAYAFTEEGDKGKVATIEVKDATKKLGFLVRKTDWSEKDWGQDRFIDLPAYTSGVVNVYVTSGVEAVEIKHEAGDAGAGDTGADDGNSDAGAGDAATLTVKLHYLREDGNYDGWNVWGWYDGESGKGFEFTESGDKGKITTITVAVGTPKVNFIVRQKQGDNDWAAKDWDGDRFVDISTYTSGVVNVYITSGVEAVEVEHEEEKAPEASGDSAISAEEIAAAKEAAKNEVVKENDVEYVVLGNTAMTDLSIKAGKDVVAEDAYFVRKYVEVGKEYVAAKKAVEAKLKKVGEYKALEIDLYAADDKAITELNDYVYVTVPTPTDIDVAEGSVLVVYRLRDDGSLVNCDATIDGDKLTFKTNHFSTFVVAAQEKTAVVPDTGDNSMLGLYLFVLLAGVAVVMTGAVSSKKRCK